MAKNKPDEITDGVTAEGGQMHEYVSDAFDDFEALYGDMTVKQFKRIGSEILSQKLKIINITGGVTDLHTRLLGAVLGFVQCHLKGEGEHELMDNVANGYCYGYFSNKAKFGEEMMSEYLDAELEDQEVVENIKPYIDGEKYAESLFGNDEYFWSGGFGPDGDGIIVFATQL